ncbi:MAG: site-specific integrase [Burkholderiaceae bacterium]
MSETILPMRDGSVLLADVIDWYMGQYAGRDTSRVQRMAWWKGELGKLRLDELDDDAVHAALERLAQLPNRFYAGEDAEGKPIYRARRKPIGPATVNRYSAALGAVCSWAMRKRITPKGWQHPCRAIARRPEGNGKTRFLSDDERVRLLDACKASKWPRLYLLVLLGMTTGARRGELLGLRWRDIDMARAEAHIVRSKNSDARVLPLVPAAVEEMKRFEGAPTALVFASTRRPDVPYHLENRWREALRVARVRNFRMHDLRHSCASWLAQSGASLLEIADVLGHRQISVTRRYAHLATGHKAQLVQRVLGAIK